MPKAKAKKDDENTIDPAQVQPAEETTVDTEVVDSPPVAQHPAHPVDEDPEEHVGDETPDPWSDSKQEDWPNAHAADDTYVDDSADKSEGNT